MKPQTLYTAVGHLKLLRGKGGLRYPVIEVNQKNQAVNMQELAIWSRLSWRFRDLDQLGGDYQAAVQEMAIPLTAKSTLTFDACVNILLVRGLITSGSGDTQADALYDLLSGLYVVPISANRAVRLAAFFKLLLTRRASFAQAMRLFEPDRPNAEELRVLGLSRQALLSTAEIIKCVADHVEDVSSDDKLLSAIYHDDATTCYNISYLMHQSPERDSVLQAVANLYLRKQVVFQRVGLCGS